MTSSEQGFIRPVIMSGGAGTRLWPLSRRLKPKQFHALGGPAPLFEMTARRMRGEGFGNPVILANVDHAAPILACLADVGIEPALVLLEPEARNTAPAIAAAVAATDRPDEILAVLPADHVVKSEAALRDGIRLAASAARDGRIVTLGLRPDAPETGFGYIRAAEAIRPGVRAVGAFVEKPDRETAESYLRDGGYFWNAGIFVFRADAMRAAFMKHRPDTLEAAEAAVARGERDGVMLRLDPDAFSRTHAQSIDYEIMERTDAAAVAPVALEWSDIGSWAALWDASVKDANGNAGDGETVFVDAAGCLAVTSGPAIALVGVKDLAVVATPDGVIVLPRSRAQDVKAVVEELKRRGRTDLL